MGKLRKVRGFRHSFLYTVLGKARSETSHGMRSILMCLACNAHQARQEYQQILLQAPLTLPPHIGVGNLSTRSTSQFPFDACADWHIYTIDVNDETITW